MISCLTDLSPEDKLEMFAAINLQKLAGTSKVQVHLGSWWEPLKPLWGQLDLVVANPPYIPEALINRLDPLVRDHEPYIALSGGEDGLMACREVVIGAEMALNSGGWLILEHHHDQSDYLLDLMRSHGLKGVDFENDLQRIKRFAIAYKPVSYTHLRAHET